MAELDNGDIRNITETLVGMEADEMFKLITKLKTIDPNAFDILSGLIRPDDGTISGPVNGVSAASPPRHETGNLRGTKKKK
jgi:hypothetical protein